MPPTTRAARAVNIHSGERKMKKKLLLFFVVALCCVCLVAFAAGCGEDEEPQDTPTADNEPAEDTEGKEVEEDPGSSAYAGRYYEVVNGKISDSLWIELDDDWGWIDDGDAFGTFTVDDEGNIELYWLVASEPAFSGTIEDGKMTLTIFYQEVEYILQEDKNADTAA